MLINFKIENKKRVNNNKETISITEDQNPLNPLQVYESIMPMPARYQNSL